MIPVSYNVRSMLLRKASVITTVLGIALVVVFLASSLMLQESIKRTMSNSGSPNAGFVLRKGSDAELASSIENNLVGVVLSAPGVKKNAQGQPLGGGEVVVVIALERPEGDGKIGNVTVRGVPDNVMAYRPYVHIVEGRPAQPGTDEVIIGERVQGRFKNASLGQSFELKRNRPVKVVGVFEAGGSSFESEVWADIETVRTSFGREGLVSSITVQLESGSKYDAFEAAVENDKQLGLDAKRENEYYEAQADGLTDFIGIFSFFIMFFIVVAAVIGAIITMYAAVAQRRREIGTLLALGFSRWSILLSFLLEAVMLTAVGGALGALASLAMSFASFSMTNMLTWSEVVFTFQPTVAILVISVVVAGIMGLLGGLIPAISAARTSPVAAMRD